MGNPLSSLWISAVRSRSVRERILTVCRRSRPHARDTAFGEVDPDYSPEDGLCPVIGVFASCLRAPRLTLTRQTPRGRRGAECPHSETSGSSTSTRGASRSEEHTSELQSL